MENSSQVKIIGGAVIGVILLILCLMTMYSIEQYERGVLTRGGKIVEVQDPGFNFKIPFLYSVTIYRTNIQEIQPEKAVNTYTVDNQEVDIVYTVFYRVPPQNVAFLYENVQDYEIRLQRLVEDRLKAEMGKVNTQHVAENRGKIRDGIKAVLTTDAKSIGLEVTDFQLSNIEYNAQFRAAVNAAAAAKANVETREQERLQEIKIADRARIKAQGEADAKLMAAKAEAEATELKGKAEAASIRAQAQALQENQKLVELRKAERWDGKLPTQMLSSVMPMMQIEAPKQ